MSNEPAHYTCRARDGEIGGVDEVLFDDEHWTVQYTVEITNELPKPVV